MGTTGESKGQHRTLGTPEEVEGLKKTSSVHFTWDSIAPNPDLSS